jgi:hypothetical protein
LLRAPVAQAEAIGFGFGTVIGATTMKAPPRLIPNGGIVLSRFVVADLAPPPHNLQQLPETRGTARRFIVTPRREFDGVLLPVGTQVHLPPHLSDQLAATVRIGDPLSMRNDRLPSAPRVVASATTDTVTNQTITDQGLLPPEVVPPSPPGRAPNPLYGAAADLNGAVCCDGTMIRMGPLEASQVSDPLTSAQMIDARLGSEHRPRARRWRSNRQSSFGSAIGAQQTFAACAVSTSRENATVDRRFFLSSSLREVPWTRLDSAMPPERPQAQMAALRRRVPWRPDWAGAGVACEGEHHSGCSRG